MRTRIASAHVRTRTHAHTQAGTLWSARLECGEAKGGEGGEGADGDGAAGRGVDGGEAGADGGVAGEEVEDAVEGDDDEAPEDRDGLEKGGRSESKRQTAAGDIEVKGGGTQGRCRGAGARSCSAALCTVVWPCAPARTAQWPARRRYPAQTGRPAARGAYA